MYTHVPCTCMYNISAVTYSVLLGKSPVLYMYMYACTVHVLYMHVRQESIFGEIMYMYMYTVPILSV